MKEINDSTYEFLGIVYERTVQEFLDDPDGCTCNDSKILKEYYHDLVQVGEDLKKPFWEVAAIEGTDYEIKLLKQMLRKIRVKV